MPKGIVCNHKYHYFYKITNLVNNKFYYGIRSCDCEPEEDPYMGSGHVLHKAFRKYGIDRFSKTIIMTLPTREDAEDLETWIVDDDMVRNSMCYNVVRGGTKCAMLGMSYVTILSTGEKKLVPSSLVEENPDLYEAANKGLTNVYDLLNDKFVQVTCEEYRSNRDRYKSIYEVRKDRMKSFNQSRVNKVLVKGEDGTNILISRDEYGSNKDSYVYFNKGKITVYNFETESYEMVSTDEYWSGKGTKYITPTQMKGIKAMKGKTTVKDKDGNIFVVKTDDPRYASGELVSIFKGVKHEFTEDQKAEISRKISERSKGNKNCLGKVCITDGVNNRKVNPDELSEYDPTIWRKGSTRHKEPTKNLINKTLINNGSRSMYVPNSELESYISTGDWKLGKAYRPANYPKGRKKMNDGISNKLVMPNEVQSKLDEGWSMGWINEPAQGKICITNGVINKMVYPDELNSYVSTGEWYKGKCKLNK